MSIWNKGSRSNLRFLNPAEVRISGRSWVVPTSRMQVEDILPAVSICGHTVGFPVQKKCGVLKLSSARGTISNKSALVVPLFESRF
jgi:hypothetical protein